MKKSLILVMSLVALFGLNALYAQNVNIPDANFKQALLDHTPTIDTDGDGEISVAEAEAFDGMIDVKYKSISDLTGVEAFVNLKKLVVSYNSLSGTLDFSANTELELLLCRGNQIDAVILVANTKLKRLDLGNNNLQQLKLSTNTLIERLWVQGNEIEALNLSNLIHLEHFVADGNKFSELDFSNNENLLTVGVQNNELTSIDISSNHSLYLLNAWNNKLTSVNVANGNNANITRMKVENNPNLTCIQHDEGFNPESNPCTEQEGWCKDETAQWSTDCSSGVEEMVANTVELYPNPTQNNVTVLLENADFHHVEVYNTQGTQILLSTDNTFSMQDFSAGIYFVKIVNKDGDMTYKKLIKE